MNFIAAFPNRRITTVSLKTRQPGCFSLERKDGVHIIPSFKLKIAVLAKCPRGRIAMVVSQTEALTISYDVTVHPLELRLAKVLFTS